MRISVKVKANSKQERVEKIDDENFLVRVKAKPADGKANEAVIKALADHFDTARSNIVLLKGHTSRQKIFEINV